MQPVRIGLDVAKNVFQVHAVDVAGNTVLRGCRPAWWALKPAAHPIIGRVSSPSLGMMCV
jgi:hypothetical protein